MPAQDKKKYWADAFIRAFAKNNLPIKRVTFGDLTEETEKQNENQSSNCDVKIIRQYG